MKRKSPRVRRAVQLFFLVLIVLIAVNHTLVTYGIEIPLLSSASIHALCPLGGVVSIYQTLTAGTLVKKIHESSFILMYIVFGLALLFGPVFCGWVCPFGTVQELIGKIGRRLFRKRFNRFIPAAVDKPLRYLRYAVLAWILYMTAVTGKLVFEEYDPYYALLNFWTSEVSIIGLVILAVVVVASLFVERPFCKYACPYGAVLGLTNFVRIFKIKRNVKSCTNCKACTRACPMNIDVANKSTVRDHQCISCYECTSERSCPVPATVAMQVGRPEVRIPTKPAAIVGEGGSR
ncbi:4Fe-4S binding protein [Salinispira pacifica]